MVRFHPIRSLLLALSILVLWVSPSVTQAQSAPTSLEAAIESITDETILSHLSVLASDQLRGRDTPSAGLETAASYLADRHLSYGLEPAGTSGTFFQRYPFGLMGPDPDNAQVTFVGPGGSVEVRMGRDAFIEGGADAVLDGSLTFASLTSGAEPQPGSMRGEVALFSLPGAWGQSKRIVITTVQKFPFILDAIGNEHRGRRFAIIIDEAHSSQGGRTSASVSMALGEAGAEEEDETTEDKINRLMESRKLLTNASYFAFTATPKSKTLEIFGTPAAEGEKSQAFPIPRLHDEAGDSGRLHHRRVGALHAGEQLLPAGQDGGGRPGVRYETGREEVAPLRREQRACHPPQGRNRGGSLSRAGDRTSEDRRASAGHGGHGQRRARSQLLLRYPRLPGGAQEFLTRPLSPSPASTSTAEQKSPRRPSTASRRTGSPTRYRKTLTDSWSAPTSSRPATTNHCCTRCMWTRCCPV